MYCQSVRFETWSFFTMIVVDQTYKRLYATKGTKGSTFGYFCFWHSSQMIEVDVADLIFQKPKKQAQSVRLVCPSIQSSHADQRPGAWRPASFCFDSLKTSWSTWSPLSTLAWDVLELIGANSTSERGGWCRCGIYYLEFSRIRKWRWILSWV